MQTTAANRHTIVIVRSTNPIQFNLFLYFIYISGHFYVIFPNKSANFFLLFIFLYSIEKANER